MNEIRISGPSWGIPKIQYCVSFWAKNITCYWELLPEMGPSAMYTLHITEEAGHCRRDFGETGKCVASRGEHACSIAVENPFAFYKIQLTVESERAQASSSEKCVHGLSIVKLSPPVVNAVVANRSRCFQLEWSLPANELLSATEAQYEIRYRDTAEISWTQLNFTLAENTSAQLNICGLFPFTRYSVQLRAKYLHRSYLQSDEGPWWSDWSTEKFVTTLPEVPSRGPALWRKLGPPGADGMRNVLLMWKPLKPKEANGEILAYSLSSQRKGEPAIPRCVTPDLQCPLLFPAVLGLTFFITARNAMGISPPTKLVIPQADGHEVPPSSFPVFATPAGDHGLHLQWFLPSFPKMGYVFEWGRLPGKQEDGNYWDYQSEHTDHIVITEAIEPGKLYSLKVFAVIDGTVWAVGSTLAYSKQIAPLRAPTLYPIQVWKNQVELQWEELQLEEQGGNIRNYSICYEEEGKSKQSKEGTEVSVVHLSMRFREKAEKSFQNSAF
ncbi:Interleukin-6 receptor subunit beta [Varanus komodoensis]|nr:Interleukin-6 receptor subunit beta [Varanus komodoensis]